jgi:predicted tellurium resistance membrane protein TerC
MTTNNAAVIAENMRRESQPSHQTIVTDTAEPHTKSDTVLIGMVVLLICLLHLYRVMVVMSNPTHSITDIAPFILVIIGCCLFMYDARHGKAGNGLIKLIATLIVAHVIFPQLFVSVESQTSCYHVDDDESDNGE